ncbi:hypothetical protein MD588_19325 [Photobacterium sp. SDRW27]|uniref:hypothetical protein n=1 Tax=Photobacterium obscurum TaxID=2829490 RepID=UPI00224341B4|nr:hypothetical protein [Photobacterium obscurum]MCW8330949.1 hypothetical protein [Photobacterium obscurum]
MTLSELFDLREKIESRVNQYWTYWSVSIFAVCGWMFTDATAKPDGPTSILIAIGLMAFFTANLSVLKTATELAMSVKEEIALKASDANFLSETFTTVLMKSDIKFRVQLTIALHLAVDLVLLFALLTIGHSS